MTTADIITLCQLAAAASSGWHLSAFDIRWVADVVGAEFNGIVRTAVALGVVEVAPNGWRLAEPHRCSELRADYMSAVDPARSVTEFGELMKAWRLRKWAAR